jgi:WD40 repeat protein
MKYDAFISYSHAADHALAPALQAALRTFAKPWYRRSALHVFRDTTSLAAAPELWPSIVAALSEARYFLLLASPRAAASPWVAREVEWWLEHRATENLLVLLTDGEVAWDTRAGDFDWLVTTALPTCLKARLPSEPLWVDLRWARSAEHLDLHHSQFRLAVLDLAAPLHGKPKDELDGDDVRAFKRTKQVVTGVIVTLTVLLGVVGWYWNQARIQRNEAVRQTRIATARQLAAQADLERERGRPELSALLAAEGVRSLTAAAARSLEVDWSMRRTLAALPRTLGTFSVPVGWKAAFTPDGRHVVAVANAGCHVVRFDVATGARAASASYDGALVIADGAGKRTLPADGARWCRVTGDGRHVFTRTDGPGDDVTVALWDVQTGALAGTVTQASRDNPSYQVSPGGKFLAITGRFHQGTRPGNEDVVKIRNLAAGRDVLELRDASFTGFSPDGTHFATGTALWRLHESNAPSRVATWQSPSLAWSASGRLVATRAADDGPVELRDLTAAAGSAPASFDAAPGVLRAVSDDGRQLLVTMNPEGFKDWSRESINIVWDVALGRERSRFRGGAEALAFSPHPLLLVAFRDGPTAGGEPFRIIQPSAAADARAVFHPDADDRVAWLGFRSPGEALLIVERPDRLRIDVWDWTHPAPASLRAVPRAGGAAVPFAVSADGQHVAFGEAGSVRVGDFRGAEWTTSVPEPETDLLWLTRTGKFLAAARGGRVRVWNVAAPAVTSEVTVEGTATALWVSEDGASAVVLARHAGVSRPRMAGPPPETFSLTRWSTAAPAKAETVKLNMFLSREHSRCDLTRAKAAEGTPGDTRWIEAALRTLDLPCPPAGASLTTSIEDKELTVTERKTGATAVRLQHEDGFQVVAFSGDEQHLATADRGSNVRIWPLDPARLAPIACERLPRAFADQALTGRVAALCGPR